MSLSSSRSQRSSPGSPCSANDGARRRFERKRALPRPPRPPCAARYRSPSWTRSASTAPVSWSRTIVPSGTRTTRSSPPRPCLRLPWPCTPLVARRCGWSRKARREATLRSATSQTSPPLPPSPPSGPPLGTWASRRNATVPAPPSPALTGRPHSSTNPDTRCQVRERGVSVRREYVDVLAATPLRELHRPRRHREEGVVAAPSDVLAGVEPGAALAHDDGAGVDDRAVEHLDAEALGVGIAAVAG